MSSAELMSRGGGAHNCSAFPSPPESSYRGLVRVAQRFKGCAARNVYIDMGANWCNSLRFGQSMPQWYERKQLGRLVNPAWQVAPHGNSSLHVYAFEASPQIAPFVERCCTALSQGEPLPHSPVPPSGSSSVLLRYAHKLECAHGSRGSQFSCLDKALNASLHALQPSEHLAPLLPTRLQAARSRGCMNTASESMSFTLLPAAVGARDGHIQIRERPLLQLLRGGDMVDRPLSRSPAAEPALPDKAWSVRSVDVVRWLSESFSVDDFVIAKMDVEGAENDIVPALLATNAARLIDVLLWECHLSIRGGAAGKCQCQSWDRALLAAGIKQIFHDPYPFARVDDYPPFP